MATTARRSCIGSASLAAKRAEGHALEAVDQSGTRDLGRIDDHQTDVIVRAIAFDQFRPEVLADLGEDARKVADGEFGQIGRGGIW